MLETVGKKLAKARKAKNLEIEDIEHRTRIPHDRLRELEDDDYSRFANLTYAKSFLKLYSDYLDVDTSEYRQELALYEVDDFGADPLENEFAAKDEPKRKTGIYVGVVLFLLATAAGAYFLTEFILDKQRKAAEEDGKPLVAEKVEGEGEVEGERDPSAKPPVEAPEEEEEERVLPARPFRGGEEALLLPEGGFEPEVRVDPGTGGDTPVVPAEVVD